MPSILRILAISSTSVAALALSACAANTSPVPVSYSQAEMGDYIMAAVVSPARPETDTAMMRAIPAWQFQVRDQANSPKHWKQI